MLSQKCGFTLMELLVVVLIIGILAAVAVPQYQFAVEKSRASEALATLKSIHEAQEVYYLANGKYSDSAELLDIEIPASNYFNYSVYSVGIIAYQKNYIFLLAYRTNKKGTGQYQIICGFDSNSPDKEKAKRICVSLGADITKNDGTATNPRWPIIE